MALLVSVLFINTATMIITTLDVKDFLLLSAMIMVIAIIAALFLIVPEVISDRARIGRSVFSDKKKWETLISEISKRNHLKNHKGF